MKLFQSDKAGTIELLSKATAEAKVNLEISMTKFYINENEKVRKLNMATQFLERKAIMERQNIDNVNIPEGGQEKDGPTSPHSNDDDHEVLVDKIILSVEDLNPDQSNPESDKMVKSRELISRFFINNPSQNSNNDFSQQQNKSSEDDIGKLPESTAKGSDWQSDVEFMRNLKGIGSTEEGKQALKVFIDEIICKKAVSYNSKDQVVDPKNTNKINGNHVFPNAGKRNDRSEVPNKYSDTSDKNVDQRDRREEGPPRFNIGKINDELNISSIHSLYNSLKIVPVKLGINSDF